jgi:hypothetical protein
MADDFRNTLIGCSSTMCRFNIAGSIERTCMLKLVAIGDTGRCLTAEGRTVPNAGVQPGPDGKIHIKEGMEIPPGTKFNGQVVIDKPPHFEGGVWVK